MLVVDSYLFTINKKHPKGATYWRCTFASARKSNPCQVRCKTYNNKISNIVGNHNHDTELYSKNKDKYNKVEIG